MPPNINRVIVIGGGLCGLIAASQLKHQGIDVTILDKGYGIGGRLASRSLKSDDEILGFFDYGMQYFSAQTDAFKSWVELLIEENIITIWPGNFELGVENTTENPIYYRGIQSNRAIAQYLAKDLKVIHQTRVETLHWQDSTWVIKDSNGQSFYADGVIMTPPVPQTLEILATSEFEIEESVRSRLEQITYEPCLSLMVILDRAISLPSLGGIQLKNAVLDWIACNHLNGISPEGYAITLLANAEFSEVHWDSETEWIIAAMLKAARPWLASNITAIASRLHRWKYRHPKTVFGQNALKLECPGSLVLAGDAFCDRPAKRQSLNLEQAFLSGCHAAQTLGGTL